MRRNLIYIILALVLCSIVYAGDITNLMSWYDCDGNVTDSGRRKLDGTWNGTPVYNYTHYVSGTAACGGFSSTQNVNIPNEAWLNADTTNNGEIEDDGCINWWAIADQTPTEAGYPLGMFRDDVHGSIGLDIWIRNEQGTPDRWVVGNGASEAPWTQLMPSNVWTMHTVSWNSTGLYLYYNNTLLDYGNYDVAFNTSNNTGRLNIGAYSYDQLDRWWRGSMDSISFWNNSCDADRRYDLWNDGNGVTYAQFANYSLDNCTVNPYLTMNISFYDENSTEINIDYETTITYWISEGNIQNFSTSIDSINYTELCLSHYDINFTADMQIEYTDSLGNIYTYFGNDMTLNTDVQELNLYTQTGATQVLFTVLDTNSDPIDEAYIHILKYNVGTGTYTTTEVLKTDTQGQAVGNIVLATTFYNFLIYYKGQLMLTESAVKLISTTRTFTINLLGRDWYNDFDTTLGVNTNLYYNNQTYNFVYTWSDPSSSMHQGCLRVDKQNDSGRYNLSSQCTESTSSSIVYNTGEPENGTSYIGTGYLKYDNEIITDVVWYTVQKVRSFFRLDPMGSLFIAMIFCLTMFLIGIPNPALSILLLVAGVIVSSMLGLWAITGMQIGSIAFVSLLQIYLIGRQTE